MATTIARVQSADGHLELVLCPASVELRLSHKAAREFDREIARQKDATWLPLWKEIKAGLLSAAQFMGHQFADTLKSIPLEAVDEVTYTDGRVCVMTGDGNKIEGHIGIKVGAYQYDCDLGQPGLFAEADVQAFARRFAEVKPLYLQYLRQSNPPNHQQV